MKYENTFLVFEVVKGPKAIVESLNTYGDEGWECCSMLIVANSQIVAFLKRSLDTPEPSNKEEEKLVKLWSNKE
jgi:hypothetical protein